MNPVITATPVQRGLFATIRERCSQRPESEHIEALVRIVIAAGVATCPQDGTAANVLIHSADNAMYETMRNGKNGYRIYHNKYEPFMPVSINGQAS